MIMAVIVEIRVGMGTLQELPSFLNDHGNDSLLSNSRIFTLSRPWSSCKKIAYVRSLVPFDWKVAHRELRWLLYSMSSSRL